MSTEEIKDTLYSYPLRKPEVVLTDAVDIGPASRIPHLISGAANTQIFISVPLAYGAGHKLFMANITQKIDHRAPRTNPS